MREAVEEARQAVVEAIRESQQAVEEAAAEAAEEAGKQSVTQVRRIRHTRMGDSFTDIAFLLIVASAILKISYKGTIQAEVKAAEATETAESEQLKRQVVEARMAAMQAQVEPHFLFNTLASIDHLIQTDPSRASQMQKNLIALLRASMPSMRESTPMAHNLGREMAVIRPYLEILKVRMEERLQTDIQVPEGLLSAEFPSMMIQSLVENAIKHGLEPKAEGGKLTRQGRDRPRQAGGDGRRHRPRLRQGGHRRHRRRPGQHPRADQAALRRPRLDDGGGQHAERDHRHPHRALSGATAGRSDAHDAPDGAGPGPLATIVLVVAIAIGVSIAVVLVVAAARPGDARDRRRDGGLPSLSGWQAALALTLAAAGGAAGQPSSRSAHRDRRDRAVRRRRRPRSSSP